LTAFGQEKRINRNKVPLKVQNFIQTNYPKAKRLKFYIEQENGIIFIECDFKLDNIKNSIKFLGDSLVEREISINFSNTQIQEYQIIKSDIDSRFSKYKVLKSQIVNPITNPIYEISIKTKSNNYFELNYNKSGQLINKKEILNTIIPSQF
jgi:hypothetical protein